MTPLAQDPHRVTRILFQDFPPWMVAAFYGVAIVAVAAFLWGVFVQLRKYAAASATPISGRSRGSGSRTPSRSS